MKIDMRKELVKWLQTHGHWIAVRVAIPGKKCKCALGVPTSSSRFCRRCFSTGRAFVDHIVKGDKRVYSPDIMLDTKAGEAEQGVSRYYVEYVVPVKKDDYILELELDPNTGDPIQPYRIQEAFKVTQVDDMRDGESAGVSGRLEFIQIQVDTVSVI